MSRGDVISFLIDFVLGDGNYLRPVVPVGRERCDGTYRYGAEHLGTLKGGVHCNQIHNKLPPVEGEVQLLQCDQLAMRDIRAENHKKLSCSVFELKIWPPGAGARWLYEIACKYLI